MSYKEKVRTIVIHPWFKRTFTGMSIIFIIATYFISLAPDSFLKLGYAGVFLFNAISSGLLLIPVLVKKLNLPGVVLASALGNIPNTSINYFVGTSTNSLFSKVPIITTVKNLMARFGLIVVFLLAITPTPFDVNGLLSGYLGISYRKYILVNFLGKLTLFTLVGLGMITLTKALNQ